MLKRLLAAAFTLALTIPTWAGVIITPSYEGETVPDGFVQVVIDGLLFLMSIT